MKLPPFGLSCTTINIAELAARGDTRFAHADVSDASSFLRAVDRLARQASGFGNER